MQLILKIKVIPNSSKSVLSLDQEGHIKAHLISQPEQGKANKELIQLIAKKIGCNQSAVTLINGETFRIKHIQVDTNLSYDEILIKLGLAVQTRFI